MALDQHEQLITADRATMTAQYHCPKCLQEVELCQGRSYQAFFRHKVQRQSLNESKQHQAGKQLLKRFYEEKGYQVALEVVLADLRADLMIQNSNKQCFVVEYQCSPIQASTLQKRTSGYQLLGYPVIWIVGVDYFLTGHQITKQQQQFLTYQPTLGFNLLGLDTKKQAFYQFYQIRYYDLLGFQWQEKHYQITTGKIIYTGFSGIKNKQKVQQRKIQQALFYQQSEMMRLQAQCYQQGRNLLSVPDCLYFKGALAPILSQPLFFYQVMAWLGQTPQHLAIADLPLLSPVLKNYWILQIKKAAKATLRNDV